MRRLALLLLLVSNFAFGQSIIISAAAGNWSNTATWTGGVVPGDGSWVVVKHNIVIDQNIGTSGGGGINTIRIELGGLTINSTAARTITFASTGTDPIGLGTAPNPGSNATMMGFFLSRGTLDLEGTSANPVTITSANGTSPWYIHHKWGDFTGCTTFTSSVCNGSAAFNGATIKFRFVAANHFGTATTDYEGITFDMRSDVVNNFDLQNSQFTDGYSVIFPSGGTNVTTSATFAFNSIVAPRAAHFLDVEQNAKTIGFTITDNTETGATTAGYFTFMLFGNTLLNFQRNAVLGTVSANRGLFDDAGNSTTNVGETNAGNLCINPETASPSIDCIIQAGSTTDSTSLVDSNVLMGGFQSLQVHDSVSITHNWMDLWSDAASGQGSIITLGIGQTYKSHHNMVLLESSSTSIGSLYYTTSGNTNIQQVDHNTYAMTGNASAIYMGEGGAVTANNADTNSWATNNLITGGANGIVDGNNADTWSNLFNSAGVHHNDVFNVATNPYQRLSTGSTGFDNGVTHHPNALYGDLAIDPQFVDSTRRPATWDTTLGGPGTTADIFTQLAKRSGFGGTYSHNYDIQNLLAYLQAGFTPQNTALYNVASDGTDIGAVQVSNHGSQFLGGNAALGGTSTAPSAPSVVARTNPAPSTFFNLTVQPSHYITGTIAPYLWPSGYGLFVNGIRLMDTGTQWSDIDTSSTTNASCASLCNWATLDQWVKLGTAANQDMIFTFLSTPNWASSHAATFCQSSMPNGGCWAPTSITTWDNFVNAVANRYKGKIHYYELWNEAGTAAYWADTIPNLVTMLQHLYNDVKAIDPSAQILLPSSTGAPGDVNTFLTSMFTNGAIGFFDIVNFHGYTNDCWNVADPPDETFNYIFKVNLAMTASSVVAPIWDTESSWGQTTVQTYLTAPADTQAWMARHLVIEWENGVARSYWYAWQDTITGTLWDTTNLLRQEGKAYTQIVKWLTGTTPTGCSIDGSSNYVCALTRPNGYQAEVVWNTLAGQLGATGEALSPYTPYGCGVASNGAPVTFTPPVWVTQYHDLSGNITAVSGNITLGETPLLLENGSAF